VLAPQFAAAVETWRAASLLVLAGYPKPIVEELKAAGIENFIYAGQNVVEALVEYQRMLKI